MMIKLKSKGWGRRSEPNYKFIPWVIMVYYYNFILFVIWLMSGMYTPLQT